MGKWWLRWPRCVLSRTVWDVLSLKFSRRGCSNCCLGGEINESIAASRSLNPNLSPCTLDCSRGCDNTNMCWIGADYVLPWKKTKCQRRGWVNSQYLSRCANAILEAFTCPFPKAWSEALIRNINLQSGRHEKTTRNWSYRWCNSRNIRAQLGCFMRQYGAGRMWSSCFKFKCTFAAVQLSKLTDNIVALMGQTRVQYRLAK